MKDTGTENALKHDCSKYQVALPLQTFLLFVSIMCLFCIVFYAISLKMDFKFLCFHIILIFLTPFLSLILLQRYYVPFAGQKNEKVKFQRHLKDNPNLELP